MFLIQFTVVKMENLEYRLLSLIYFMIMIQLWTHSRYCIKTTKPILKLFRLSDSPKGKTHSAGSQIHGDWENWRFSTEALVTCQKLRCLKIGHNRYLCIRHATPTVSKSCLQQKNFPLATSTLLRVPVPSSLQQDYL